MGSRLSRVNEDIARGEITPEEGTREEQDFFVDTVRRVANEIIEENIDEELLEARKHLERERQELAEIQERMYRERVEEDHPEEQEA